jgi:uncharacterized protein (TIGR02246 family)
MTIEVFGTSPDREADVEAIVALVARVEHAQQNEQPEAFMAEFSRRDPVWTTAHGMRLSGWDMISDFTHQVLPGAMKDSSATYEVVRVQFIRPDVAAVNVHQRPLTLDGKPLPGTPEGRPLYVLAKDDGEWRIAAAQNTRVHEG